MKPLSYSKPCRIGMGDVDFRKSLKPSALLSWFQDAASRSIEGLDIDVDRFRERCGLTWVLNWMRLEIVRMPVLGESLTIETWAQEVRTRELQREFLALDGNGGILARGTTSWFILDLETKSIRRVCEIDFPFPESGREPALPHKPRKLNYRGEPAPAYRKVVGYSDIDLNGHVNNVRYVDYAMDCLSLKEHAGRPIRALELRFLREALPGDELLLTRMSVEGTPSSSRGSGKGTATRSSAASSRPAERKPNHSDRRSREALLPASFVPFRSSIPIHAPPGSPGSG